MLKMFCLKLLSYQGIGSGSMMSVSDKKKQESIRRMKKVFLREAGGKSVEVNVSLIPPLKLVIKPEDVFYVGIAGKIRRLDYIGDNELKKLVEELDDVVRDISTQIMNDIERERRIEEKKLRIVDELNKKLEWYDV